MKWRHFHVLGMLLVLALAVVPAARAEDLVVYAASSLTEAFGEIAAAFEAANPGVHVLVNFAGSATLATQIVQGAPADVFASADVAQMQVVARADLVAGTPADLTGNRLVVVAAAGTGITSPEDLARKGLRVVLAAPEVPVGAYSRAALAKLDDLYGGGFSRRVAANVVSEELNVRQVAAKVELGEADAAVVYATDADVMHDVVVVPIPDAANVVARYQIAVMRDSPHRRRARSFVAFALSAEGRAILSHHGFTPPGG